MIPDFPGEKQKIMAFWNWYLGEKHKQLLGIMGQIPSHMNHEGHRWTLSRSDGTEDESQYNNIQGTITIDASEVPQLTPVKIREKMDQVAEEMARQTIQGMIAEINRVTESVGNSINAGGQPLTQELFLQMLERIDLNFDENGKWLPPTMILSPEMLEKSKEKFMTWDKDPEFLARQEEIVVRKREDWRDRENRRKLVD